MLCVQRIIPQAVSVRYGLSIGAACAPLVLGMMYLFGTLHVFTLTTESACY